MTVGSHEAEGQRWLARRVPELKLKYEVWTEGEEANLLLLLKLLGSKSGPPVLNNKAKY